MWTLQTAIAATKVKIMAVTDLVWIFAYKSDSTRLFDSEAEQKINYLKGQAKVKQIIKKN